MTKKDYVLISNAFKSMRENKVKWIQMNPNNNGVKAEISGIDSLAIYLADRLQDDNSKFDRNRFLTACGYLPE